MNQPEVRAKMRASRLGKKATPKTIKKMRAAMAGRKMSTAARARMRVAAQLRVLAHPTPSGTAHHNWRGGRLATELRHNYGMTLEAYHEMLIAQSGRCALSCCDDPVEHVDHDHETGVIRGLLCARHNRGLGAFHDSPDELLAGADYLTKSPPKADTA